MRTVRSKSTLVIFIAFLLLTSAPSPTQSLFFSFYNHYRNLSSLAHSLFNGVANLRSSRGDVAGADRARGIADKLERGLGFGFWRIMWSTWMWTWRELPLTELYGAVSDMNELLSGLTELTRMESAAQRSAWVSRNYQNVLTVSKSLYRKLLKAFGQSELMETLQIEVVEGGLIRDCLELGSNDFKALIQVVKDLVLQFFPVHDKDPEL
ncbi:uncharacterized protein LOC133300543 [Gastrolobium bilobum]|uniref:uncharacterized protein LOC133300543 n=1 Tax=Gastrolobium bilobum TaxID=150636 RepID=UPI002AB21A3D|nr:uncharacterized protein LOC133300543 [Gastrolobium bilobum]